VYLNGTGVDKDEVRAVEHLKQSCDRGSGAGCSNLGTMYENGKGVPTDRVRAVGLYQQGCKAGSKVCCDQLKRLGELQ
jgi:hypothetical protein